MQYSWAVEARDQCIAQKVPLFFKQWGKAENNPLWFQTPLGIAPARYVEEVDPNGKGGALLDGVLWREYPEAA